MANTTPPPASSNETSKSNSNAEAWILWGSVALTAGAAVVVAVLSTSWIDVQLERTGEWLGPGFIGGLVLVAVGIGMLGRAATAPGDQFVKNYDVLLARVGYSLVVAGALAFIGLFGLASRDLLEEVLGAPSPTTDAKNPTAAPLVSASASPESTKPSPNERPLVAVAPEAVASAPSASGTGTGDSKPSAQDSEPGKDKTGRAERRAVRLGKRRRVIWGARMALMPGFAVLGSLFFISGSLRRKRSVTEDDDADVVFNATRFWSGFWYRVGEGILFGLVVFLAAHANLVPNAKDDWSPSLLLLGLMMAMFVKPAEQLVNGLALRLFEAVTSFTNGQKSDTTDTPDPLTAVVERLSDSSTVVRIQALNELLRHSPKRYAAVVKILAAFIREPPQKAADGEPAPADVAEAVRALFDLKPPPKEQRPPISLRGAVLRGVRFGAVHLDGVDLTGADLRNADFSATDLTGATLTGARFDGANMNGAKGVAPPP